MQTYRIHIGRQTFNVKANSLAEAQQKALTRLESNRIYDGRDSLYVVFPEDDIKQPAVTAGVQRQGRIFTPVLSTKTAVRFA